MTIKKIEIAEWLKCAAEGRTVYWFPNPGNAGDALIAAATEAIFRRARIRFVEVSDPSKFRSSDKFVCYGGGGNFVGYYRNARKFLQRHHQNAARLVIFPHTIEGNEDLLGGFSPRVTIICRDSISYAHCRVVASKAEILAADDLALSLEPRDLSSWRIVPSAIAEPKVYLSLRQIFQDFVGKAQGCNSLTVWRSDGERHPSRTKPPTNDISSLFSLKSIGVDARHRTLNQLKISAHFFLRTISRFHLVRTDRLHVAIAAAILDKRVELYSNAYYKNKAVYEFSLQSFPNVRFLDRFPANASEQKS